MQPELVAVASEVERHDVGEVAVDHAEVEHERLVENAVQLIRVGDLLVGSAHLRRCGHGCLRSLMVIVA